MLVLCRCTFGDIPPRVDAVKIYQNVGPEDQVLKHMLACTSSSLHVVARVRFQKIACSEETGAFAPCIFLSVCKLHAFSRCYCSYEVSMSTQSKLHETDHEGPARHALSKHDRLGLLD